MSRSYDHVEFRPWYVPDTAGWLGLSLAARGLVADLVRKFDKRGELAIRRLEDLCILLRLSWAEVEPAVRELIERERLHWDETNGILSDPDFVDRMRQGSAARMHRKRATDAARARESVPPPSQSEVTRVTDVTHVTSSDRCDDVTSPLILSDLISSSSQREKIPEEIPSAREPEVADPLEPPPEWFAGVLKTVGDNTGVDLPVGESWLRYAGHRGGKAQREGRAYPPTRPDAVHWVTTVLVKEARERRDKARQQRDRDEQRRPPNPADPAKLTEAQQKQFAENLRKRMSSKGAA